MKRQALEQVIGKHMRKMKKRCHRIPGQFAADDIHDVRVEYKKLRALCRLLDLRLPKDLKMLYKAAGKVRDLQLFIDSFPITAPAYIEGRQKELFAAKEALVRAIEQTKFKKIKGIPAEIHNGAIANFISQRMATIHLIALVAEEETDLHDARKQMKDIMYVRKLEGNGDEALGEMATQLGNFNDRCQAANMLANAEELPPNERSALNDLKESWTRQKDEQQQQLLQQLKQDFRQ